MSEITTRNVLITDVKVGLGYNMAKNSIGVYLTWNADGLCSNDFIPIWDLADLLYILDVSYIEDLKNKPVRMKNNFDMGSSEQSTAIGDITKDKWWYRPTAYPQKLLNEFNTYIKKDK